jgi:hypothetical protein
VATCWLTEPSSRLVKPPRPRLPTTSIAALRAASSRMEIGSPITAAPETSMPGSQVRASAAAAAAIWSNCCAMTSGSSATPPNASTGPFHV